MLKMLEKWGKERLLGSIQEKIRVYECLMEGGVTHTLSMMSNHCCKTVCIRVRQTGGGERYYEKDYGDNGRYVFTESDLFSAKDYLEKLKERFSRIQEGGRVTCGCGNRIPYEHIESYPLTTDCKPCEIRREKIAQLSAELIGGMSGAE